MSRIDNPTTIAVRAFTELLERKGPDGKRYVADPGASNWTLVFDTETTVDERQALRFGFYQLRKKKSLFQKGTFYDPEELSETETELLKSFALKSGFTVYTVSEFIEQVFLGMAYEVGAAYVGFNLPFDLSRLAIGHGAAQASKGNYSMVGGFSFRYIEGEQYPRIQVKHISDRSSLIRFTMPRNGQQTPRSMRERGLYKGDVRGHFVDIRSLAGAILSGSWSLKALADILQTEHRKLDTKEHGDTLTEPYIEYAAQDVQVTWECFEELSDRYHRLKLSTRIEKIISEASIGKAYLDQMGIKPWMSLQSRMPKLLGAVMSSFYGGRAEVHARRITVPVAYCDFLSMYPTVCTLMKLWRFVTSEGIDPADSTELTKQYLEEITLEDLKNQEAWQSLTTLVRVAPNEDIFPVRAKYEGEQRSIGLNYLTSEKPLWFTLADCVASKLLTGKAPTVLKSISFTPKNKQEGLRKVEVMGNPEYAIDPNEDDFLKRVIELRHEVKTRMKKAEGEERERLESEQLALKICANATSYGIYVELNSTNRGRPIEQVCYGYTDGSFQFQSRNVEEPGRFFHPLLGTLITGAARLMLAMCECVAGQEGLTWAFCDTDGIALTAKDQGTKHEQLIEKARNVQSWFKSLNPYAIDTDILKLEDENFGLESKEIEPLYCFAISAKRYALFNLDVSGMPILRKATAHGLGHLMAPYEDSEAPDSLPKPKEALRKIGVKRWQHDLWVKIILSSFGNEPERVDYSDLLGFENPAVSRYAATSTELVDWFKVYNRERTYKDQVRPFGFMLSLHAKKELGGDNPPRASAPFNRDLTKALNNCFDRETGNRIPEEQLKTVRESLVRFHLHPESKFLHGNYLDCGFTQRRQLNVTAVEHIGKESNRWEEQFRLGESLDTQAEYGQKPDD
jgi:DNA polymerase family B